MVVNSIKYAQDAPNRVNPQGFTDFKQPQNGYFISPEFTKSDEYLTEEQKTKKHVNGWIIASASVLSLAILALGFSRILPKKANINLDKLRKKLERKVAKGSKESSFTKLYGKLLSLVQKVNDKTQGFNNIVSFKDILFKKMVTDKVPFLKRVCGKITGFFDNIGQLVVRRSYHKTAKKMGNLNNALISAEEKLIQNGDKLVEINGRNVRLSELVKELKVQREQMFKNFEITFSDVKISERNRTMKEGMKGLEDYVWNASFADKRNIRKKDTYFTFVAEKYLSPVKTDFMGELNAHNEIGQKTLEEILKVYKTVLDEKEYKKLSKLAHKSSNSLRNAIKKEGSDYFDKLRDWTLGAAPTDVISMLTAFGSLGAAMLLTHDEDSRKSVLLKYGIPAIGGMTTSMILTAALVSGGKALAIGTLSGLLMNAIGAKIDNKRKQANLEKR